MRLSTLIFTSIFFILLLFSLTTYINYHQSENVRENADYLANSGTFIRRSDQLQRNILNMERNLRGYLMTGEDYLLQTYTASKSDNEGLFNELSGLSDGRLTQQEKLRDIEQLYREWISRFAEPAKEAREKADSNSAADDFEKGYSNSSNSRGQEELYKKMQVRFAELRNEEYRNRNEKRVILEHSERQTKRISFLLTALSICTGFFIAILLARHISRRIRKMVNMAENIASGNYKGHLPDKGNDELSHLAASLNNMSDTLSENIAMLSRKNLELDQFAHIVSHDLKAPLQGIDNVISWIEEDYGSEIPVKVQDYLKLIRGRVERLKNLIEGILSYARIGKNDEGKEEISLTQLLSEIVEGLPSKPGLKVEIGDTMPIMYSQKVPLVQVFTNLLSNAIKYNDKEEGMIRVYCKVHEEHYEFSVADNGPGIAPAYHEKIFVIFQTLQDRDTFESTGVGLAIVKKIMLDRKETITVSSEPGKGSVFTFTWKK